MQIPGKIANAFNDELFGLIHPNGEFPEGINYEPEEAVRIVLERIISLTEINEIEQEIQTILERLGTVNGLLVKAYSIEELVIGVKHYLIAWSTLKDLMVNQINICFELGIHENDLNYGSVMRNKKVSNSNIPNIIKANQKSINVGYTDKQRNDAIHRGKLLDDEINDFRKRNNKLLSKKYSLLNTEPISDEEFNAERSKLNAELSLLVQSKRKEYQEHYDRTIALNIEIAKGLAKVTADGIPKSKI